MPEQLLAQVEAPAARPPVPLPATPAHAAEFTQEAQRQQALLAALWHPAAPVADALTLAAWPGPRGHARPGDGLAAYRRNARAGAHRALQAAYPVLCALVGEEAARALALAMWQQHPPHSGDLGTWGAEVATWLEAHPEPEAPYLADIARLEWALHLAGRAADGPAWADPPPPPEGLAQLAGTQPTQLHAQWRPGTQVLTSDWPVLALWQAHQPNPSEPDAQALAAAGQALARGEGGAWLVWRPGWQARAEPLPLAWVGFTQALIAGSCLGDALAAHPLAFEDWLIHSLRQGWLIAWRSPQPDAEPTPCST